MNYVIVKTVRGSRKMFSANNTTTGSGKVQETDSRSKSMKNAESQLTVMLLMVTTLFLILLCPTYIRFIYLTLVERDTPLKYARSFLVGQVTGRLYTTNSGVNFFLYCISGQKFRNDVKEILCHCIPLPKVRKEGFQSNTTELSTGSSTTLTFPSRN